MGMIRSEFHDIISFVQMKIKVRDFRGKLEELFGSRERELKITFPFYGKGTGTI